MKQPDNFILPPMIVLAGGRSERYGSPKGLAKASNVTLLHSHINSYSEFGNKIVVVLGYYTTPYILEIDQIKSKFREGEIAIDYTVNENFALGPFSSIQAGLKSLGDNAANGVFIQPVDSGVVSGELYRSLFLTSDNDTFSVVPEWHLRGGHPVFISSSLAKRLLDVAPASELARLDFQLKLEPKSRFKRMAVNSSQILENRNFPT